jgi:excisionase family DNA binding protein
MQQKIHFDLILLKGGSQMEPIKTENMDQKISYKEASSLLGVPIGTIYAWVCLGKIPHYRLSTRLVRFSKQELLGWFESKRQEMKN